MPADFNKRHEVSPCSSRQLQHHLCLRIQTIYVTKCSRNAALHKFLQILVLILLKVKHASKRPVYVRELCTRCKPIVTTDLQSYAPTLLQPGDIVLLRSALTVHYHKNKLLMLTALVSYHI